MARFDTRDRQTQLILTSLLESKQNTTREIEAVVAQLLSRLEAFDLSDQHRLTRDNIILSRMNNPDSDSPEIQTITSSIDVLTVSPSEELKLRSGVQQTILDHLSYPAMPQRYEQVIEAHPTTFEWAFKELPVGSNRWDNLAKWLKTGNGVYWVSGKPGSGKSTLMKHIYDDSRTRFYLKQWAQMGESTDVPLLIGTFFFWTSGSLEQRSQIGMLRAVLFQILDQKPELLPVVFPALWAKQYEQRLSGGRATWAETWTLRTLMAGFQRLIAQQAVPVKIFFLIDGLDEFDGDHEVLAELFNEVVKTSNSEQSNWIKCCVSSRPWVVFKENFEGCPTLQLQDLTANDIKTFVNEKTFANSPFRLLAKKEPQATSELIQEIVEKAEGVFLWVHVVVLDLLRGIRKRDTIPDLWRRLEALPNDLDSLYRHIVSQIEPAHQVWASKTFQILRAVREVRIPNVVKDYEGTALTRWSLGALYLALDETLIGKDVEALDEETLDNKSREVEYHISARCACLLEVIKPKDQTTTTNTALVQYLHRTARDFLESNDHWNGILDQTRHIAFDPYFSMMRCKNLQLYWHSPYIVDQRRNIYNTIVDLLAFASEADTHAPSYLQQRLILDDTNTIMSRCDIYPQINIHTIKNLNVPKSMRAITAHGLAFNLAQYVDAELRRLASKDPSAARSTATQWLMERIIADRNRLQDEVGLPYMKTSMAAVLIKHGASVNYRKDGISTWETFLVKSRRGFVVKRATKYNPNFAKLMNLFLASGADRNPVIETGGGNTIELFDYFQKYVQPVFYQDEDCINEIQRMLESKPPLAWDKVDRIKGTIMRLFGK